jgi:hypothetical protein
MFCFSYFFKKNYHPFWHSNNVQNVIVWLLWLLQVLKKSKWLQLNEYRVELNEGADMVFVLLLVLMMHDMERMSATMNAVSQIHSL